MATHGPRPRRHTAVRLHASAVCGLVAWQVAAALALLPPPSAAAGPRDPRVTLARSGTRSATLAIGAPRGGAPAAASGTHRQPAAPLRVRTGVLLLRIGDVDVTRSRYTMDFYLILRCDRPCDPGGFEVVNGRVLEEKVLDVTPTERIYRIYAMLTPTWNFRAFPFDENELALAIEDESRTVNALVYVPDPARTGVDADAVVGGWDLRPRWRSEAAPHHYPVFDQTYSRFTFATVIRRPLAVALLNVILPGLIIVLVGMLSLFMRADQITPRLAVSTSALVATVLFHLNLRASLPVLGYFTFADRFMVIGYVVLGLTVAVSVVMQALLDRGADAAAERVRRTARWGVPLVWLVLQGISAAMTFG